METKLKGLFLNTAKANCSIYESGKMCFECLKLSNAFRLDYQEIDKNNRKFFFGYDFYIFNYHQITMGWLSTKQIREIPGLKFTLVLEVAPNDPFVMCPENDFDAYIVLDPTLKHNNKNVYAFPRPLDIPQGPIPEYKPLTVPQIGSFGFGTKGKGFELVIDAVNKEFEFAIIKLNIPKGNYVSLEEHNELIENLKRYPTKKGIKVEITNEFFSKAELINWCAKNTINVFLYNRNMPGLSATTDQAILSERPLAVSKNDTFRHITTYLSPYPEWSLKNSIEKSVPIIKKIKEEWAPINFAKRFEFILGNIKSSKRLLFAQSYLLPRRYKLTNKIILITIMKIQKILHIALIFLVNYLLLLILPKNKGTVFFINNVSNQCGVYQYGKKIGEAITKSKKYKIFYIELSSNISLLKEIFKKRPSCIIYNYYDGTMSWLQKGLPLPISQVSIVHETLRLILNAFKLKSIFDYYIVPDPNFLLFSSSVFKTGRLIPVYKNRFPLPKVPTIGSFGLGTNGKGFENIVKQVQEEFDEAIVRFNIPFADVIDKNGRMAKDIAKRCHGAVRKNGISLEITHNFLEEKELLDFLAQNTINIFLYEGAQDGVDRGISSVIDYALAVERPIAISNSTMFRHIKNIFPSIIIPETTIKQVIANGFTPIAKYKREFCEENLIWDYERILSRIFQTYSNKRKLKRFLKILFQNDKSNSENQLKKNVWLRSPEILCEDDYRKTVKINYTPVMSVPKNKFNRILDKNALANYKEAIETLFKLVPKTMSKKIPAANINQGFVFDTVFRFIDNYKSPKVLCIGSYEDTACMSLIKMGYDIEEIDPVINYSLQEFFTKPSTQLKSYDIIFSISVIEHDPDDKSFIQCVDKLLAPGGIFVMTCDYKDKWRRGDPKPIVDCRLYTKNDLEERLLSYMTNCELIDKPDWNCQDYDFEYEGINYTFASFVVRKTL